MKLVFTLKAQVLKLHTDRYDFLLFRRSMHKLTSSSFAICRTRLLVCIMCTLGAQLFPLMVSPGDFFYYFLQYPRLVVELMCTCTHTNTRNKRRDWAWGQVPSLPGALSVPVTSQWRSLSQRTQQGISEGEISSSTRMPTYGHYTCCYPFKCWTSSKEAARTILKIFGMTRPRFEPLTS